MGADAQVQYVIVTPVTATGIQLVPFCASGALTLNGQPANNDQFSITLDNIAAFTYTFKTALTPAAGEVLIGTNAADSLNNLYLSITGGAGGGTKYVALAAGAIANATPSGVAAFNISLQAALYAKTPSATTIPLFNGVGWTFTLATPTNVSTNLAKTDFTALTGLSKRVGKLHKVSLRPNTQSSVAQLYDSAQLSGAATGPCIALMDAQTPWTDEIDHTGRVQFLNGLYAIVTSTGSVASLTVTYE